MLQRKIDEFELHETLGVGTVGTIYRATDLKNEQEVAVKILLSTVTDDELISARFEREMVILEKLSHPNIVRYYGGGLDGKQRFFALELIGGGTLKDMLAQTGRLPWKEAATIGVQICSALQHAHNHGIIHRDLKPANLLFTDDGQIKLSDFGIALDATAKTITAHGLTVGSYAYMPPEQIIGERSITGQTDLYAFGCLVFEMITGRPPYEGDNFAQIFEQHLNSPVPHVRDVEPVCPEELDALIVKLLQKEQEARPFNARAVQGALMEILDPSMQPATPAESTEDDVPASEAVDEGRRALTRRLSSLHERPNLSDVSWTSLGILFLVIVLIVGAAFFLGTYF